MAVNFHLQQLQQDVSCCTPACEASSEGLVETSWKQHSSYLPVQEVQQEFHDRCAMLCRPSVRLAAKVVDLRESGTSDGSSQSLETRLVMRMLHAQKAADLKRAVHLDGFFRSQSSRPHPASDSGFRNFACQAQPCAAV